MECFDLVKVIIFMNFDRDIRLCMVGLMLSFENNRLNKLLLEFFFYLECIIIMYIKLILYLNIIVSVIY